MIVEEVCIKLPPNAEEELRNETSHLIKWHCSSNPNITEEEVRALKESRHDHPRVILIADKGIAIVMLDEEYYINKAQG